MSDDLLGPRMDVLAEAHDWLSMNADPDALEAGGAVTPSTKLVLALKTYAQDLAAEVDGLRTRLAATPKRCWRCDAPILPVPRPEPVCGYCGDPVCDGRGQARVAADIPKERE